MAEGTRPSIPVTPDLFEVALRTGGLGAWESDLVAGTRSWTAGAAEILGLDVPTDRPIPFKERDHLREVMHPDDRALLDQAHAAFAQQDEIEVAYRVLRPDTGLRHIVGRGRVVARDGKGAPVRVVHIVSDTTERHEIENRTLLLMRELTHRTKNQLAIILALARRLGQSAETIDAFQVAFIRRLVGMSASVDALVEPVLETVSLKGLILGQLRAFDGSGGDRVALQGEDLELDSGTGQVLGMALHELAANAHRHGALGPGDGRVEITWTVERDTDGRSTLVFEWRERNGPSVIGSGPPGFGSVMLTRMTEFALNATVDYDLGDGGVYWGMAAPVAEQGAPESPTSGIRLTRRGL